jgi:SAM-dependent methyltransferase
MSDEMDEMRPHRRLERYDYSAQFVAGNGIEVGALHRPLPVSERAHVTYVDRMSRADLLKHYPELGEGVPEPDVVDDGERLTKFADDSQDFVIANHFIEHCEDPIGTLKSFARVIKPGGVLYLGVPDKRYNFDIERPLTTKEHLFNDHEKGPRVSRIDHYLEYAKFVSKALPKDLDAIAKTLEERSYSIHFHVWTLHTFLEFLLAAVGRYDLPLEIELTTKNLLTPDAGEYELIVILRKTSLSKGDFGRNSPLSL